MSKNNKKPWTAKVLVHYLRDSDYVPFGCIVAISPDAIGVSICNTSKKNGDRFSKWRAREIALGRAMYRGKNNVSELDTPDFIPNKTIYGFYGYDDDRTYLNPKVSLKDYVRESVERIRDRAKKYFKEEQSVES